MKVFAYCTQPAAKAVRKATGVNPVVSPPATVDSLAEDLAQYDLLYFRLHSKQHDPDKMYGEDEDGEYYLAFVAQCLRSIPLPQRPIVVLANCYGAESEFPAAFYQAGASIVVAGHGPNMAGGSRLIGTDLMVYWLIKALEIGVPFRESMQVARARLALTAWRLADRDAMQFVTVARPVSV
jgi:hypothetical protein